MVLLGFLMIIRPHRVNVKGQVVGSGGIVGNEEVVRMVVLAVIPDHEMVRMALRAVSSQHKMNIERRVVGAVIVGLLKIVVQEGGRVGECLVRVLN